MLESGLKRGFIYLSIIYNVIQYSFKGSGVNRNGGLNRHILSSKIGVSEGVALGLFEGGGLHYLVHFVQAKH